MKILVLIPDAFGGYGGIALYNRDLLNALCDHPECEEVVALPQSMSSTSEPMPEKLTYVTDGIINKMQYVMTVLHTIRKNPDFDIIICGHINLLPLAWFARLYLRKPLILEIYGIDAWMPTKKWLVNQLVNKIDSFVSISEITRSRFLSWANVRDAMGFILPNAVHAELYGPGPKNPELLKRYGLKDEAVLMTLGRLATEERYKGFDEIIELLPDLLLEIPNIAFIIAGDGSDRSRLEQKAKDVGVDDRVVFTGRVSEEEKADHYRLADVYVMPSAGEGFGFVFLEAMACGIPVIASKTDGGREALRDGSLGMIVDPQNKDELKSAILKTLKVANRTVPDGIEYFSFINFKKRVHRIVDDVVEAESVF